MKKSTLKNSLMFLLLVSIPAVTFASGAETQINGGFTSLGRLVDSFTNNVVAAAASLLVAAGTVAFFYGMVQYIWGVRQGDAGKTKAGNIFMIWGLVGVFVMVSVWGIVYWFQSIFGIQDQNRVVIPRIQVGASGPTRTGTVNVGPLTSPGGSGPTAGSAGAVCNLGGGGYGMTDASGNCVSSGRGAGAASASDPGGICAAYGPGTGCRTSNGEAGACNASNICVSQAALTP